MKPLSPREKLNLIITSCLRVPIWPDSNLVDASESPETSKLPDYEYLDVRQVMDELMADLNKMDKCVQLMLSPAVPEKSKVWLREEYEELREKWTNTLRLKKTSTY